MKVNNNGDSEADPLLFSAKAVNGRPNFFIPFFIAALILNVGGVLFSVNVLIQYDYTNNVPSQWLYWYNVVGVVVFLFSVIVGPVAIGFTLIELSRWRRANNAVAAITTVLIGAACLLCIVPAWTSMIEPETTFVLQNQSVVHYSDQLRQFLGGFITIIYPMVAVMCFVVAVKFARRPTKLRPALRPEEPSVPHERSTLSRNLCGIATLLSVAAIVWFFTTFLSGTWNYGVSYFYLPSVWSIAPAVTWRFGPTPDPSQTWLNDPVIVFKVYEDVCVWFSIVVGVALLGVVGVYTPSMRRLLHRRVFVVPRLPSWFFEFSLGFSVGEICVILAVFALFGYNLYYWAVKFTYIDTAVTAMGDPYPLIQKWARIMGHMATLSMSFLILPVARNSVWEACFGIPFERFVKYHRVMGRLCWTFTTIHMILFQAKWLKEGILWNNVFTIRNLLITNWNPSCPADAQELGSCAHFDNWTIVVVESAWLVLTLVLIVATFARRYNYDLFLYTHYFSWFFLVASLTHAWTHWYYVATGFVLYFLDKLGRTVRSCEDARLVSLSHAAGVTRLEVSAGALRRGFAAGQYAFVNIPAVSMFQWHPFTVSSSPYTVRTVQHRTLEAGVWEHQIPTATFHIKDMGKGTWTNALAEFACSFEARCEESEAEARALLDAVMISIDGPYGRPALYHDKESLVMVAGGIGITPFHSILTDIYRQTFAQGSRLRNVHLVWVVRDPALLAIFADSFAEMLRKPTLGKMPHAIHTKLHLYCTGRSLEIEGVGMEEDPSGTPMLVRPNVGNVALLQSNTQLGRPDLAKVFKQAVFEVTDRKSSRPLADDIVTLVCGPEPMIAEASQLANRYGTDFFSEVFHF